MYEWTHTEKRSLLPVLNSNPNQELEEKDGRVFVIAGFAITATIICNQKQFSIKPRTKTHQFYFELVILCSAFLNKAIEDEL